MWNLLGVSRPWGLRFDYSLGDLFAELRWILVWNSQGHFQDNPTKIDREAVRVRLFFRARAKLTGGRLVRWHGVGEAANERNASTRWRVRHIVASNSEGVITQLG